MAAAKKSPREHLHSARTIAVKPVVVEAIRRKHAALQLEHEESTGKKVRAGVSPPILPAAIILSGLLVYEKKFSKGIIKIKDAKWIEVGLTKNEIERGERLLDKCGFVEKRRAGYKGSKHYEVDHRAIAEQIDDLLNPTHKSETEGVPESDALVGNRNPTHRSETEAVLNPTHKPESDHECISSIYGPKDGLIDPRARARERNGHSSVTGDGSIDDKEKPSEKSPNHKKAKSTEGNVLSLNDFEAQVKNIPESAISGDDRRFENRWRSQLGEHHIETLDLARLAHLVGIADRRRLEIAAKTCAAKVQEGTATKPWRYMLKCGITLVQKQEKRSPDEQQEAPFRRRYGPDGRRLPLTTEEKLEQARKHNFVAG